MISPVTAYTLAERFLGLSEVDGHVSNPQVLAMLQLDNQWVEDDETPWCSAFVNYVAHLLDLPRTRSLAARSWLKLPGPYIPLAEAERGFDVLVLKRGPDSPGPLVLSAPGHVGFFSAREPGKVRLLAGNQGDSVSVASFPADRVLGVRRLFGG